MFAFHFTVHSSSQLAHSAMLLGANHQIRITSLLLGTAGLILGLFLLIAQKRWYETAVAGEDNPRVRRFELRKFRRRSAVASLIASVGCLMGALYWVNDPKTFSIFILLIMGLLISILGIACFDLFSVSLQTLTKPDDESARKAMIDEYLRQRKKAANRESDDP